LRAATTVDFEEDICSLGNLEVLSTTPLWGGRGITPSSKQPAG
jgi:hypothetical protein